jgi:ABC-type polysaccharide/polyol phosphate transport system ATPase subunit
MSAGAVAARGIEKSYWIPRASGQRKAGWRARARELGRRDRLEVRALDDVSFDVNEGEVFGIIGRNGAGKSTLLKILARITSPTRGTVRMRGHVASLLEVGTGFHPDLTGRENVYLNGMLLGMSTKAVDRAFDEIVEFAGVGPYIDVPIKRYSSGMQLRLAFAVAAHLAADTMIIDEVLAVGDAEFQRKCLGAMRDVSRRGRTTLFVSHNMSAVESLCSRVMWLDYGRVRAVGAADHVIREYLTAGAGHAADKPPRVELREAPRTAWTTGMGRITAVEFERLDRPELRRSAWHVDFGEQFALAIDFELDRYVADLVVGLGLRNDRGEDVLTSHSIDTPFALLPGARTQGRGRVTVSQPWLRPGMYYLEVALLSGAQMLDHVGDAAVIAIEEQSAPDAPPLALKKGIVAPIWEWHID